VLGSGLLEYPQQRWKTFGAIVAALQAAVTVRPAKPPAAVGLPLSRRHLGPLPRGLPLWISLGIGALALVLIAVLASVAAAFFYLRVVALMYMREAEDPSPVGSPLVGRLALAVPAVLTLLLGVVPSVLLNVLHGASALLGAVVR